MQKVYCPKCRRQMTPMNPLSEYLQRIGNVRGCTAQRCQCGYRSIIQWAGEERTLMHDEIEDPKTKYLGPVTWMQAVAGAMK
jgi:hypothetical protein